MLCLIFELFLCSEDIGITVCGGLKVVNGVTEVHERCYVLSAGASEWDNKTGYGLYGGGLLPPDGGAYWAIGMDPSQVYR